MEVVKVKKVLLVIDMQNVCVGEKHAAYFKYDNEILIQAVNKVIEANKDNPDFIFISIARQDSKDNINKWISEKNPTQDVVFDDGEISLAFGVTGQPETFAIGKDGIVSSTLLARASQKSLNEMLSASS